MTTYTKIYNCILEELHMSLWEPSRELMDKHWAIFVPTKREMLNLFEAIETVYEKKDPSRDEPEKDLSQILSK